MVARYAAFWVAFFLTVPSFVYGADTISFGCPAYLIGGRPNLSELKQKGVTSIVIDPSSGISASQAQSQGILAVYYVNSFCQPDKFRCSGPTLSGSGVSRTYGEVIPQPDTQFFYDNFSAQVQRVQRLGGTVIEIDNMDEYVQRGHINAIKYLIESASRAGINVLMKNETNATLIALPNVVGAIAEPGSHGKGYRAAFTSAGKATAGVMMINGSAGDSYTSVSNVNHTGGNGEYTTFYSCTSSGGGARAPSSPAGAPINPPQSLLQQGPTQNLLSNLQSSLSPLAQPLLQQPPQRSSVQPFQYFTSPSVSSVPINAGTTVAPQPSVAESLLQLLQPRQVTGSVPVPTSVVTVSTSTSALKPTTITVQEQQVTTVPNAQAAPSTFTVTEKESTHVAPTVVDVFSALLQKVADVLRSMLIFLQTR